MNAYTLLDTYEHSFTSEGSTQQNIATRASRERAGRNKRVSVDAWYGTYEKREEHSTQIEHISMFL